MRIVGECTLQKKETQHAEKYNLLPIFNIILNTEITITLHCNLAHWLFIKISKSITLKSIAFR
jgi:hypothetical protein